MKNMNVKIVLFILGSIMIYLYQNIQLFKHNSLKLKLIQNY